MTAPASLPKSAAVDTTTNLYPGWDRIVAADEARMARESASYAATPSAVYQGAVPAKRSTRSPSFDSLLHSALLSANVGAAKADALVRDAPPSLRAAFSVHSG
jgi:hypothetical protein